MFFFFEAAIDENLTQLRQESEKKGQSGEKQLSEGALKRKFQTQVPMGFYTCQATTAGGFPLHMKLMKLTMENRFFEMEKRLKTFERSHFPYGEKKCRPYSGAKQNFARAGFVYTGRGDLMQCVVNGCELNAGKFRPKEKWHDKMCPFTLMTEETDFGPIGVTSVYGRKRIKSQVGFHPVVDGFVRTTENYVDWEDPSFYAVRLGTFTQEATANPFKAPPSWGVNDLLREWRLCAKNGFMWDGKKVVCAFGGPFGCCELDVYVDDHEKKGEFGEVAIGHIRTNVEETCPFAQMTGLKIRWAEDDDDE